MEISHEAMIIPEWPMGKLDWQADFGPPENNEATPLGYRSGLCESVPRAIAGRSVLGAANDVFCNGSGAITQVAPK